MNSLTFNINLDILHQLDRGRRKMILLIKIVILGCGGGLKFNKLIEIN